MKKLVVFTGSGISAESGLKTFRDSGGLWENFRVEEVATPQAWQRNTSLVLEFYNQRRKQVLEARPNAAHVAIAGLEKYFDVQIVTQNIDDLHERAGSSQVTHLHGEIRKARSTADSSLVYPVSGWELKAGDRCEKGSQLRPHIVWFGELVPELERAAAQVATAELFLVIGTSLAVYPAAGLIQYVPLAADKYFIDPKAPDEFPGYEIIREAAGTGMPLLAEKFISKYAS